MISEWLTPVVKVIAALLCLAVWHRHGSGRTFRGFAQLYVGMSVAFALPGMFLAAKEIGFAVAILTIPMAAAFLLPVMAFVAIEWALRERARLHGLGEQKRDLVSALYSLTTLASWITLQLAGPDVSIEPRPSLVPFVVAVGEGWYGLPILAAASTLFCGVRLIKRKLAGAPLQARRG
jgi:hypothetical protein